MVLKKFEELLKFHGKIPTLFMRYLNRSTGSFWPLNVDEGYASRFGHWYIYSSEIGNFQAIFWQIKHPFWWHLNCPGPWQECCRLLFVFIGESNQTTLNVSLMKGVRPLRDLSRHSSLSGNEELSRIVKFIEQRTLKDKEVNICSFYLLPRLFLCLAAPSPLSLFFPLFSSIKLYTTGDPK